MDEKLQVQALGRGGGRPADFVDGQLARQDDARGSQRPCRLQGFGMGDVGQGGQVQLSPVARLAGQFQQAGVLKDEGVRPGVAGHAHHEAARRGHVAGFDQGVEGDIYPAPLAFRQVDHARQFGRAEVVGSGAGGKMLEPHVYGVGSGGQGGEKGGRIPGRSQEFGQGQGRGGGGNLGHESSLAWGAPSSAPACGPDVRAGRAAPRSAWVCLATAIMSLMRLIWLTSLAPGS